MFAKVKAAWASLPEWARKAVTDFLEAGIAAIATLNLAIPHNLDEAKAIGLAVAVALLHALVSAIRRNLPDALAWAKGLFA